jgi:hypothetical protein
MTLCAPYAPAGEPALLQERRGAEGATAPETLRPKDRLGLGTLESSLSARGGSPTE